MIVICQTGNSVVELTNWKPESTPVTSPVVLVTLEQGAAKVDWVTVWFFSRNWNWMTSPLATFDSLDTSREEVDWTDRWGNNVRAGGVCQRAIPANLDDVGGLGNGGTSG